jgi:hypothetical protein
MGDHQVAYELAFLLSPTQGLIAQFVRKRQQRRQFVRDLVIAHVRAKDAPVPLATLGSAFGWPEAATTRAVTEARRQRRLVLDDRGLLRVPDAREASIATR